MSRPQKQTVDYFPHFTKPGKTLFILERRFGNDGYAFWFKLLEILGSNDGHAYDINNENDKEYLWAYMNVSEEVGREILDTCSELGAIDKDLYLTGIIWSDNFVANLAHLYNKRVSELPQKPVSAPETLVLGDGNPQSKVKYSKVKNKNTSVSDKIVFDRSSRKFQGIDADYLKYLKDQFPAVDVETKIKEMEAWLDSNPKNQKSNYKRFITNWLKREQDRAPRVNGPGKGITAEQEQKRSRLKSELREAEENLRIADERNTLSPSKENANWLQVKTREVNRIRKELEG